MHQSAVDAFHLVGHLAEPDDVRTQPARLAAFRAGGMIAEIALPFHPRVAAEAPGRLQFAVHVQDAARAGALVKVVDILGDDEQLPRPFGVEPRQRAMRGVGLDLAEPGAARVVEGLDERRIARERLGRRDVLDAVALPQAVRAAEGGEAALRRDAGAGQDDDVAYVAHALSLSRAAKRRDRDSKRRSVSRKRSGPPRPARRRARRPARAPRRAGSSAAAARRRPSRSFPYNAR